MEVKKYKRHAAVKSVAGIVLLLVFFSFIVSIIGFKFFTDALLKQYSDGAFLTARTAASLVDAGRMDEYASSGGTTEEYLEAWDALDRLCNSSGSTFIYVIEPDLTDYAHITFIFSTIDHKSHYSKYDFGFVRETTNDEYKEKYRALYEKEAEQELVIRDKGYIETDPHITAMIGLKDKEGNVRAILCVQRQMDVLTSSRKTFLANIAAALGVLVLFVILIQSVFLHFVLLKPLKQISDETVRFADENTLPEKKLTDIVKNKDEIGALAASVDGMEERITSYVGDITRITAEKERISTELSLAKNIQAAMLPSIFPPFPERSEFDIYASMDPAKEVGGDFYDFFLIDDDHLCMVMADVSGKGIPAALFMMASKIIIKSHALSGKSPAEVLAAANSTICANNEENMFVTVWIGILEISTGRLTAANAGHEDPVLMNGSGRFEIFKDKHGFVIGGMDGLKYRDYEIMLQKGAKLFLYTDGVPEATRADNELFGMERTVEALNTDPGASPEGILRNVRAAVDGFVGDAEQFDDITMLLMEYR